MQRYDTYKDSGVKWLGEIPGHWETMKSKYLWKESFSVSENGNEDLLSVSQYDGVTPAKGDSRSESLKGYKIVSKNDLVINIMLAWLGGLGVSEYDGLVSPAYCIYKICNDSNPKYLHYLYKTPLYLAEFARHSSGVVPSRWRMYTDDFGQVISLLPPKKEQDAIVDYLDEKMAKIDAAIAQQQKMIELLNERKQIIINRTVTRGLNPDAKMKDSGVEWIGEIPVGWKMMALRFLGFVEKKIINPQNHKSALFIEYSMPAYDNGRTPNVVSGENLESSKIILNGSTLLINKLNVHKKRIWFVQDPVVNSVASTEFVPLNILTANPLFIEYALQNQKVVDYLVNNSYGATNSQRRVSPETILRIKLPIPSDYEQIEIIQYLNKRIVEIDLAIDTLRNKISLLQERKQIIINEVVTGKVKVTD